MLRSQLILRILRLNSKSSFRASMSETILPSSISVLLSLSSRQLMVSSSRRAFSRYFTSSTLLKAKLKMTRSRVLTAEIDLMSMWTSPLESALFSKLTQSSLRQEELAREMLRLLTMLRSRLLLQSRCRISQFLGSGHRVGFSHVMQLSFMITDSFFSGSREIFSRIRLCSSSETSRLSMLRRKVCRKGASPSNLSSRQSTSFTLISVSESRSSRSSRLGLATIRNSPSNPPIMSQRERLILILENLRMGASKGTPRASLSIVSMQRRLHCTSSKRQKTSQVQVGSMVMLSARRKRTSGTARTKYFSLSAGICSGRRKRLSSEMQITLPISERMSRTEMDLSILSFLSGEEEARLIVRLTGDCELRSFDILKALPLEMVLMKFTFQILRVLKRFSWLPAWLLKQPVSCIRIWLRASSSFSSRSASPCATIAFFFRSLKHENFRLLNVARLNSSNSSACRSTSKMVASPSHSSRASLTHSPTTSRQLCSSISSRSCDLNFFRVTMQSRTSPKLKTSDLKGLAVAILLCLVLTSSGARKGTVPRMVASSRDSFETILQLPTSQSLRASLEVSMMRMFQGLMSQWAIWRSSRAARALRTWSRRRMSSLVLRRARVRVRWARNCSRLSSAHSMTMKAYFLRSYWLRSMRVTRYPSYFTNHSLCCDTYFMNVISFRKL